MNGKWLRFWKVTFFGTLPIALSTAISNAFVSVWYDQHQFDNPFNPMLRLLVLNGILLWFASSLFMVTSKEFPWYINLATLAILLGVHGTAVMLLLSYLL